MDFWVSQKWLKTETPEGDQQGAQEVDKRDIGFDLPGRIEMDFRVSTKNESRRTAEWAQRGKAGCSAAAGPPCGDSKDSFFTLQVPSSETLLGNY